MRTRPAILALGSLVLTTGCLTFNWQRSTSFEPPAAGALVSLRPGASDLTESLAALGAPLYVWEQSDGAALAWGWYAKDQKGINLSVPITREATVSFDYQGIDQGVRGVVLFFDADWMLLQWREGELAELANAPGAARPALVDDDV